MEKITFENLTEDFIDMVKAAGLEGGVMVAIKMVSEGNATLHREVNRSHLVKAMEYFMTEFQVLKVKISKLHSEKLTSLQTWAEEIPQIAVEVKHDNIHTDLLPAKYDSDSVTKQERIHIGGKPFACPKCDLVFKHYDLLEVHERSHTREMAFACSKMPTPEKDPLGELVFVGIKTELPMSVFKNV